jgi:NAD(P)-dependent dehydrogenase (short-subunit alcohol dehydrogenase family)
LPDTALARAPHGITVHAIAPALIEEPGVLPGSPEELRSLVLVGRLGKLPEVAELALAMLTNGYRGIHPR